MSPPPSMSSGVTALTPTIGSRSRSRSPSQKAPEMRSASHNILSSSPNPKRLNEHKKKQTSFESCTLPVNSEVVSVSNEQKADLPETANKYENVSDNGSEISDEGYRSLGLIQNGNTNKRASVHSQVSNEDAENSGKANLL